MIQLKAFEDYLDALVNSVEDFSVMHEILRKYIDDETLAYIFKRIDDIKENYQSLVVIVAERENDDDVAPSISKYSGCYNSNGEEVDIDELYPDRIVLEIYHRDLSECEYMREAIVTMFLRLLFNLVTGEYHIDTGIFSFRYHKMENPLDVTEGYRDDFMMEIPFTMSALTNEMERN